MKNRILETNIHSVVDVITNSSTTIFIYQNCVEQVKELVQEVLNLSGIKDKTSDDIFYYGVFCKDYIYLDYINENDGHDSDIPLVKSEYGTPEYEEEQKKQKEWLHNLKISIIKGEKETPKWFEAAEEDDYSCYNYSTHLNLIVKDEKYNTLADKIKNILKAVDAEGFRDG